MPLSSTVKDWLRSTKDSSLTTVEKLAGGDINDTLLVVTGGGQHYCIKQNDAAPEDFFAAEAEGLEALAATRSIRVPQVIHVGVNFLVLEYIEAGGRGGRYWEDLGQGLARMHRQSQSGFGFVRDTYCGLSPQPNPHSQDGHDFFGRQRLLFQARRAFDRGLLDREDMRRTERLVVQLRQLIPEQQPALLHGDLWAGNIHSDPDGKPVLIDPATYCGWPEADVAMTLLFGGFDPKFYRAYLAENPLESGWRDRSPVYNLYHLLNHLNLFGGSYRAQVTSVLRRYT